MLSKVLLVVLVTVALCMVHCCAAEDTTNDPKTGMSNGVNKDGESAELSQTDIMLMCNESFRTSMGMSFFFNCSFGQIFNRILICNRPYSVYGFYKTISTIIQLNCLLPDR